MKSLLAVLLFSFAPGLTYAATSTSPKTPWYRLPNESRPKQTPGQAVVVNAASFLPGVSPGALATVFGQDLTDVTGTVTPNSNPLPLQLANVQVLVNGVPAPLFSVAYSGGQDQISFQVPYATPTGPGAVHIQVIDYGSDVADITADSYTEDPGIFSYSNGYAVAQNGATNGLIGPNNPASPGDVVVLYTTGLGPLSAPLSDGYGAPSNPLATTIDPFTVTLDGEQCTVLFSGLAPGFVGLDQINFIVPGDASIGDLTLQIHSPYEDSNKVKLSIQ